MTVGREFKYLLLKDGKTWKQCLRLAQSTVLSEQVSLIVS